MFAGRGRQGVTIPPTDRGQPNGRGALRRELSARPRICIVMQLHYYSLVYRRAYCPRYFSGLSPELLIGARAQRPNNAGGPTRLTQSRLSDNRPRRRTGRSLQGRTFTTKQTHYEGDGP
ncbi:hypothetical protein EVAR_6519_1 [Eumeta japonica]|uniref:Uncharacterized protein n=1 Tax=Eumeta variegata TaxID=151549 RepID=A0A4C1SST2_EUMVA|nr:hypothetical protein EVAR_6519_1 [Eumeta japonica]